MCFSLAHTAEERECVFCNGSQGCIRIFIRHRFFFANDAKADSHPVYCTLREFFFFIRNNIDAGRLIFRRAHCLFKDLFSDIFNGCAVFDVPSHGFIVNSHASANFRNFRDTSSFCSCCFFCRFTNRCLVDCRCFRLLVFAHLWLLLVLNNRNGHVCICKSPPDCTIGICRTTYQRNFIRLPSVCYVHVAVKCKPLITGAFQHANRIETVISDGNSFQRSGKNFLKILFGFFVFIDRRFCRDFPIFKRHVLDFADHDVSIVIEKHRHDAIFKARQIYVSLCAQADFRHEPVITRRFRHKRKSQFPALFIHAVHCDFS